MGEAGDKESAREYVSRVGDGSHGCGYTLVNDPEARPSCPTRFSASRPSWERQSVGGTPS